MPKVYVVNNSGHDFSKAEKYGDVEFITEGMVAKFQTNQMYRECADVLKESEPDDYLLITGLTLLNVVATAVFAYLHGTINLLIYDAKEDDYVSRSLVLGNLLNEEEE